MRRGTWLFVVAALAIPATPSCSGTETGNPPFAPDMGAGGYDPMGLSPDPAIESALVRVEEATAERCDGARHPLFRGGVLDFTRGTISVVEAMELPPGAYCALELQVAPCADPDTCRTTTEANALAFDGIRRTDAALVELRDMAVIAVRLEGMFDLDPELGALLIALDRTLLTAPLGLSSIPAVDGVVRIDATTNADRLPTLRTALADALSLRRDLDGDAILDPEELTPPPLAE